MARVVIPILIVEREDLDDKILKVLPTAGLPIQLYKAIQECHPQLGRQITFTYKSELQHSTHRIPRNASAARLSKLRIQGREYIHIPNSKFEDFLSNVHFPPMSVMKITNCEDVYYHTIIKSCIIAGAKVIIFSAGYEGEVGEYFEGSKSRFFQQVDITQYPSVEIKYIQHCGYWVFHEVQISFN